MILAFVYVIFCVKPFYTPAVKLGGLNVMIHYDDTIRIAYIGDSWAEKHQFHKCIIDSMVCNAVNKPVLVRTAGFGGFTSKDVYNGFFHFDSMRQLIEWGPDYCFVVTGINDTDRKKGRGYYKNNMKLIIETLLENHITPIILEIPSYYICLSYKRKDTKFKIWYFALVVLTWSKLDCIDDYRNAFNDLIRENQWENDVITVSNEDWNLEGYKDRRDLYDEDHMHLNEHGYLVLDSCISYRIINYISSLN
jgi:lysophospholipase L1-like esterase